MQNNRSNFSDDCFETALGWDIQETVDDLYNPPAVSPYIRNSSSSKTKKSSISKTKENEELETILASIGTVLEESETALGEIPEYVERDKEEPRSAYEYSFCNDSTGYQLIRHNLQFESPLIL